jgi:uncharacterized membrane protein YbhN (UPF0104 family)
VSKYLRFGISAVLLTFVATRTNWSDVVDRFSNLHIGMWLAAFGLLVLGMVGSVRRWQVYAQELGFERRLAQYCVYYFVGIYFNLVLPTSVGGDVMRVIYLNGNGGRKWLAFVSVLLERANALLVLIAFACVGRLFCPISLPLWIDLSVWGSAAAALLGLLMLCVVQRSRPIVDLLFAPRLALRMSLLSVMTQGASLAVVWCLTLSIGLEVPFAYVCVFVPMLTLLMLLPISVNGMGIREGGMVLFLAPLGVDTASALTLAFVLFSVGAAVSLLGGVIYLFGAASTRSQNATAAQPSLALQAQE